MLKFAIMNFLFRQRRNILLQTGGGVFSPLNLVPERISQSTSSFVINTLSLLVRAVGYFPLVRGREKDSLWAYVRPLGLHGDSIPSFKLTNCLGLDND